MGEIGNYYFDPATDASYREQPGIVIHGIVDSSNPSASLYPDLQANGVVNVTFLRELSPTTMGVSVISFVDTHEVHVEELPKSYLIADNETLQRKRAPLVGKLWAEGYQVLPYKSSEFDNIGRFVIGYRRTGPVES